MSVKNRASILIVGNTRVFHVGHHFEVAARRMGLRVRICGIEEAFEGPLFFRKLDWWLRGHKPYGMAPFERKVLAVCREFLPTQLISTGLAPLTRQSLEQMRKMGIGLINFLTDDPWNPAHRASWFLHALPIYDRVFTPRRANLEDLKMHGCQKAAYLPFAYSPEAHYPEPIQTDDERRRFECDVVFAGGADKDRIPYVRALVKAGLKTHLYGGYWNRYSGLGSGYRGMADLHMLRMAAGAAKVTLCLVRRANRDGHCMRTFETPAMRGCMLTEDTPDHREIFGPEGQAVLYFRHEKEMMAKAQLLTSNARERERLTVSAHDLVTKGKNTYRDRLTSMLGTTP